MTVITTNIVKTERETALQLSSGFTFINAGVAVSAEAGLGIFSSQGSVELHSYGSVIGFYGGITLEKGDNSVHLGAGSFLRARGDAISIGGSNYTGNSIFNEGYITSENAAIRLWGMGNTITNSGTIVADINGISLANGDAAGAPNTVINTGTISVRDRGLYYAAAIWLSNGTDTVINQGHIEGDVRLGGGDNLYDGRKGSVIGTIEAWIGSNTLYGGAASDEFLISYYGENYVDGGDGVDTLRFDYARDDLTSARIDLRLRTEQQTGSAKSTIVNIENVTAYGLEAYVTGDSGNNVLTTGDKNDTLDGWFGDDILHGGAGIDTLRFSGDAGAKADLSAQGSAQNTGYGHDVFDGFENIEGGSGADYFKGDDKANLLIGNDGNDTFFGGGGNDTLDGGSGINVAVFSGRAADYSYFSNKDGSFSVTGPDGTDILRDIRVLQFSDRSTTLWNSAPNGLSLSSSQVAENALSGTILATLSATDADGDALTYNLESAGSPFRMDGNNLVLVGSLDFETKASHSLTITAQDGYGGRTSQTFTVEVSDVVETNPQILRSIAAGDTVTGEAGDDLLYGQRGSDRLLGGEGNDKLYGGAGKDVLTGGAGDDIFVFDTTPSKTNIDQVTDFSVADDTIHLAKRIFTKLTKTGVLKQSEFYLGTKAHDRDDRVIYAKKTGVLYYDADGTGSKAQVQIATLSKNLSMTFKDFFVI